MRLNLEVYLLIDFTVSAALLALTARVVGGWRPWRVAVAALMSAFASALIQAKGYSRDLALAVLPLSVFVALGWSGRAVWLKGVGWCALLSAAFAGCMTLLQPRLPVRGMARAPLLMTPFFAALWFMRPVLRVPEPAVRMRVATGMGTAEFPALIDTGNQLREPFSGQPVLIVCADSLRGALDAAQLSENERTPLPPGFRIVCYHALGGGGRMRCFRPKAVKRLRRGRWVDAPAMWVGVYCGRLPGGSQALAPACCAAEETADI